MMWQDGFLKGAGGFFGGGVLAPRVCLSQKKNGFTKNESQSRESSVP